MALEHLLFLSLLLSFLITIVFTPRWIKKSQKLGLLWEDMNKYKHPKNVASSGGLIVIFGFVIGVLFYVALRTFIIDGLSTTIEIFALLCVVLILGLVGLVDDFFDIRKKKGNKIEVKGLSRRFRIFLALIASIPLVVINAGAHIISVPFLGQLNLGLIYPLIIIPVGIVGSTTVYNFLAGFNGLEAGMGVIILGFLSFIAYVTGSSWLALIGLIMVASLIGFLMFNFYPAKVFPGDGLTYSVGALIAIMAILGNFEKIAVFVFIPYIIEITLKSRGGLKKHSFGEPQKDNSLELKYNKIYGITHLSIFILKKFKKRVYEKDVVYFIWFFQIAICLIALFIFKHDLFGI